MVNHQKQQFLLTQSHQIAPNLNVDEIRCFAYDLRFDNDIRSIEYVTSAFSIISKDIGPKINPYRKSLFNMLPQNEFFYLELLATWGEL